VCVCVCVCVCVVVYISKAANLLNNRNPMICTDIDTHTHTQTDL
jgi:hypothetical protein